MRLQSKILLLVSLFIFVSCKEDDDISNIGNEEKLYYPINPGAEWCYEDTSNNSHCLMITGQTQDIDNETYYIGETRFSNTDSINQYWARVDESGRTHISYVYQYLDEDYTFVENRYYVLKEFIGSDEIGKEFEVSISSHSSGSVTYTSELLEKGLSRTVNGIVYNDVLKIKRITNIKRFDGNGDVTHDEDTSEFMYYLAKGVGVIESEFTTLINVNPESNTTINKLISTSGLD